MLSRMRRALLTAVWALVWLILPHVGVALVLFCSPPLRQLSRRRAAGERVGQPVSPIEKSRIGRGTPSYGRGGSF
jgi:hypothetical protein